MSDFLRAHQLGVIGCHGCGLVCEHIPGEDRHARCPRCHAVLRRRHRDSFARPWAFLLAAAVFYVPANILPVMYTSLFGSGSDNTIIGGIMALWADGSYDVAVVIFVASVVVPCAKFLILGLLLITAQQRSRWATRERARLYRLVELAGYWSMLDVLVVAIVAALVKFQSMSEIEPRTGILFFGMTVILTMLSAMNFDPRLIWDDESTHATDL
jgi:paraquat-inducible protein A